VTIYPPITAVTSGEVSILWLLHSVVEVTGFEPVAPTLRTDPSGSGTLGAQRFLNRWNSHRRGSLHYTFTASS
jgi:hypothetical protein